MKRKRRAAAAAPSKKAKLDDIQHLSNSAAKLEDNGHVQYPVLTQYYPKVVTLRQYLLSELPASSRKRRKRIVLAGLGVPAEGGDPTTNDCENSLAKLLDSTIVGVPEERDVGQEFREKAIEVFTQQLPESTVGSDVSPSVSVQSEIVEFVIWLLFRRHCNIQRPPHLLCHGFQRAPTEGQNGVRLNAAPGIPGIVSHYPNSHVGQVKSAAWCCLLPLLGKGGDRIMIDLLVHCGIYLPLVGSTGNLWQLSGAPLCGMKPRPCMNGGGRTEPLQSGQQSKGGRQSTPALEVNKPTAIKFVRSRMLYARAALNAKGGVRFGMRHIHILNRCTDRQDRNQTIQIMKYIFPRQFGLHNVFTSKVDYRDTAQPFKDYTLREQEISRVRHDQYVKSGARESLESFRTDIPKRLRGHALDLVSRFRALHGACSYTELLRYYCPVKTEPAIQAKAEHANSSLPAKRPEEQPAQLAAAQDLCFTDLACLASDVSAFCRTVLSKVVPYGFWGEGPTCSWNMHVFLRQVDRFIALRKFESLTLHEVMQDLKIADIAWLQPPKQTFGCKMSQTDFLKRRELLMEFVYYIFDSFLIPLIRSNFHVTESNVHKNRLFYFRHDVWRTLAEPSLTTLKPSMFEEMRTDYAQKVLARRPLGYSHIRLLPKATGVRPITNLRRRVQVRRGGNVVLARSINSVMTPTFNVLNYEKSVQPARLGSSLFSIGDIFPKLRAFRSSLQARGLADAPLFFAKLDVQSCFDTIPQRLLIPLMESLLSADDYRVNRHAEVRPLPGHQYQPGTSLSARPLIKYVAHGRAAGSSLPFDQMMRQEFANGKNGTVFVDSVIQTVQTREDVLGLLGEHVERNIVKIGKKFYRQKQGVPQGSVVSTLLCNFFYAQLEEQYLGFLRKTDCLLLRLIDDFLLITLHKVDAERFVRVMYEGIPEYGVSVKKQKALVNFDVEIQGVRVNRLPAAAAFPYCGISIDTASLDVCRAPDRKTASNISDTLTVDISAVPGQTFHRKALNALKIRMHKMFFDTAFNALPTVLTNLYHTFHESALRCYGYLKSLPPSRQPPPSLLIRTVTELVGLALAMMKRRTASKKGWAGYECTVGRRQTKWLACKAFRDVFQRRQTKFAVLLAWLDEGLAAAWPTSGGERRMLESAASH